MFAAGEGYAERQLRRLSFEVKDEHEVLKVLKELVQRVSAILNPTAAQPNLKFGLTSSFRAKAG